MRLYHLDASNCRYGTCGRIREQVVAAMDEREARLTAAKEGVARKQDWVGISDDDERERWMSYDTPCVEIGLSNSLFAKVILGDFHEP